METVFFILTNVSICESINTQNKKGKTPLFSAKDPKYLYLLLSYGADPTLGRVGDLTLLEHLIRVKPDNARALLNYELDTNDKESNDNEFLFIYRLRLMLFDIASSESSDSSSDEMTVMSRFNEFHKKTLLNAPTAEVYLHIKWSLIKKFYILNSIMYLFYLISLTGLVYWTSYSKNHNETSNSSAKCDLSDDLDDLSFYYNFMKIKPEMWPLWIALHILTFLFTLAIFGREMLQLRSKKDNYFKSKENWLELVALVCSLIYLLSVTLTGKCTSDIEQAFGAVALFFAWIEMTLMIGRLPTIGIYIFMSVNVMKQLVKFFTVYFTILVAFACAFSILLPKSVIFENLLTSLLKVFVMMIGELEFEEHFTMDSVKEQGGPLIVFFTQIFFIALVTMVSITLANLIIGMTVSNISELQREATTYRLQKTLEQVKETGNIFLKHNKYFRIILQNFLKLDIAMITFLRKMIKSKDGQPLDVSNVRICVKPQKGPKSDFSATMTNFYYKTYVYDQKKDKAGKSLNIELPDWIINNTKEGNEEHSLHI